MSPSTSEIASDVREYVIGLYSDLFDLEPWICIGLAVFAIGFGCLCFVCGKRRELRGKGTSIVWRVAAFVLIAAVCLLGIFDIGAYGGALGYGVSCVAGIAALVGIAIDARWGKYAIVAFIWLTFIPQSVSDYLSIRQDYDSLSAYGAVSQLGVFAADNFLAYRMVIDCALGVVLSGAVLLLFHGSAKGGNRSNYRSDEAAEQGNTGESKGPMAMIVAVIVLLAIPIFLPSNLPGYLVSGTASLSNEYVSYLDSYISDETVADETEWLDGFQDAAEELYYTNGRFLNVDPTSVRRGDLLVFASYSEASYEQMQVIEDISEGVSARVSISDFITRFNETIDAQAKALGDSLQIAREESAKDEPINQIAKYKNIVFDSLFFYVRLVGLRLLMPILAVVGFGCFVAAALFKRRTVTRVSADSADAENEEPDTSPPSGEQTILGIEAEPDEDPANLHVGHADIATEDQRASGRSSVPAIVIAVIVVIAVASFEIVSAYNDQQEEQNSSDYVNEALITAVSRPMDLTLWLREARAKSADDLTNEYLREGIDIIDLQLDGLERLDEWEGLPEGTDDLANSLSWFVHEEKPLLQAMREELIDGRVPSFEEASEYSKLHYGEQMQEVAERLRTYLFMHTISSTVSLIGG